MSLTKSDTLQVPGASLYYKVRGSGPLLLILQGGDGDADGSDSLADHLVDYYTVVTYDRRGLSRSKLDEPFEPPRLETHRKRWMKRIAALKKISTQIVPAGGRTSRKMWTHHSAEALADQLGTAFVEFPGGHNGHVLHPRAFAERLRDVLGMDHSNAQL